MQTLETVASVANRKAGANVFGELFPTHRHGYRSAGARSGRICANCRCGSRIAQIIDEDFSLALRLGHGGGESVRSFVNHTLGDGARKLLDEIPILFWRDWHNHVKPFAAG